MVSSAVRIGGDPEVRRPGAGAMRLPTEPTEPTEPGDRGIGQARAHRERLGGLPEQARDAARC
ncbi:hypothetical protein [Streptomyces sp. NPDC007100]|uniref:hypothetical protein n=1 Tax=Streptomyces sp. NPDC007100 TaxID=3155602 RepID=UPI0033DE325A